MQPRKLAATAAAYSAVSFHFAWQRERRRKEEARAIVLLRDDRRRELSYPRVGRRHRGEYIDEAKRASGRNRPIAMRIGAHIR